MWLPPRATTPTVWPGSAEAVVTSAPAVVRHWALSISKVLTDHRAPRRPVILCHEEGVT
jgi:hypothetical protein